MKVLLSPEYAAGFFDGEGCVNFGMSRYYRNGELRGRSLNLRASIGSTDLLILQEHLAQFKGSISTKRLSLARYKPQWVWSVTASDAIAFLTYIRPHLRIKARQVDVAFEFHEWRQRPIDERCYKLPGGQGTWKRTSETLDKEAEFKLRMHHLNSGATIRQRFQLTRIS